MRAPRRLLARLLNFATRRRGEERLREEIESHLAILTEENTRAGMGPAEARRQARLKLGSVELIQEDYRAEMGLPSLESLLLDVRYALRGLRRSPAFSIVAVLTLMLAIGANVLVFGVMKAVLHPRQDVVDPDNLYQVRAGRRESGRNLTTSYPAFEDFRQRSRTFSGLTAMYGYSGGTLRFRDVETEVGGYEVSGNYFDLLGAQPALGQFFHEADENGPGSAPFIVLSHGLWRSAFHADGDVVGMTVRLDDRPFTVIGVASVRFHGTERFAWPHYWIPLMNRTGDSLQDRARSRVTVIGRLKPGVTPEQAAADLNAIASQLADEHPKTESRAPLRLVRAGLYGDDGEAIRGSVVAVNALALLLLLAACVNLASLFAARTADRARELAVRVALGSSRRRLIRQLLTEAMLISLIGGGAGLLTAHVLLGAMNRRPLFFLDGSPRMNIDVDTGVYLLAAALILGSALLFGMVPAWRAWQGSPLQVMKCGPVDSPHLRRFALRDLLLGAQIAICTLLVTASLVAAHSLVRMLDGPIGIKPRGAMLASLDYPQGRPQGGAALERTKAVLEAARSLPGVTAVGAAVDTPMNSGKRPVPIYRPGTTELIPDNTALLAMSYSTSPGYLEAAGTRRLAGRDFTWNDVTEKPSVAIVNETFARTMWSPAPAIGQTFLLSDRLTEVVGVVEDGKYHNPMESWQPALFVPLSASRALELVYVVRSPLAPDDIAAALRRTLGGLEPSAAVSVTTWPGALAGHLRPVRIAAVALGVIGFMAAMLAATGIFGMAAYTVSRRQKELGIRRALGALTTHVMGAAVGRPAVLLAVGSAAGLLAGILASRLLGYVVYQADPGHPTVLLGAVLAMAVIGIAGSALPAWRALAVDPSRLMREE